MAPKRSHEFQQFVIDLGRGNIALGENCRAYALQVSELFDEPPEVGPGRANAGAPPPRCIEESGLAICLAAGEVRGHEDPHRACSKGSRDVVP